MRDAAGRAGAGHALQLDAAAPSARRRTAGEASGLSPGGACDDAGAGGARARRRAAAAWRGRGGRGFGAVGSQRAVGGAADFAAAGAGVAAASPRCTLPAPSTSMPDQLGAHRHHLSPTSPPSASTLPATGDGISTVALSVITRRATWSSLDRVARLHVPGDDLDLGDAFADVRHLDDVNAHRQPSIARLKRRADALRAREIRPFLRVRIGRVPAGDALDRRLEVIEAMLLHQRRQLGAEAAGARGFVHDHAAAGLLHRVDDGVEVQRPEAAQVDDLGVDAGLVAPPLRDTHTIVP